MRILESLLSIPFLHWWTLLRHSATRRTTAAHRRATRGHSARRRPRRHSRRRALWLPLNSSATTSLTRWPWRRARRRPTAPRRPGHSAHRLAQTSTHPRRGTAHSHRCTCAHDFAFCLSFVSDLRIISHSLRSLIGRLGVLMTETFILTSRTIAKGWTTVVQPFHGRVNRVFKNIPGEVGLLGPVPTGA